MTTQETQRPPPVSKSVLEAFKQDVRERRGRIRGVYSSELEKALEAWIDASEGGDTNDRLARIEQDLAEVKAAVEQESAKNKKQTSARGTTETRLKKIQAAIDEQASGAPKAHEKMVEAAIREHAGGSDPTIRRYKRLLVDDRELFEDPRATEPYFFRDAPTFATAVNDAVQDGRLEKDAYVSLVEDTYDREWWGEQVQQYGDETDGSPERGIQ